VIHLTKAAEERRDEKRGEERRVVMRDECGGTGDRARGREEGTVPVPVPVPVP
jgi:hypothetical protein